MGVRRVRGSRGGVRAHLFLECCHLAVIDLAEVHDAKAAAPSQYAPHFGEEAVDVGVAVRALHVEDHIEGCVVERQILCIGLDVAEALGDTCEALGAQRDLLGAEVAAHRLAERLAAVGLRLGQVGEPAAAAGPNLQQALVGEADGQRRHQPAVHLERVSLHLVLLERPEQRVVGCVAVVHAGPFVVAATAHAGGRFSVDKGECKGGGREGQRRHR